MYEFQSIWTPIWTPIRENIRIARFNSKHGFSLPNFIIFDVFADDDVAVVLKISVFNFIWLKYVVYSDGFQWNGKRVRYHKLRRIFFTPKKRYVRYAVCMWTDTVRRSTKTKPTIRNYRSVKNGESSGKNATHISTFNVLIKAIMLWYIFFQINEIAENSTDFTVKNKQV